MVGLFPLQIQGHQLVCCVGPFPYTVDILVLVWNGHVLVDWYVWLQGTPAAHDVMCRLYFDTHLSSACAGPCCWRVEWFVWPQGTPAARLRCRLYFDTHLSSACAGPCCWRVVGDGAFFIFVGVNVRFSDITPLIWTLDDEIYRVIKKASPPP